MREEDRKEREMEMEGGEGRRLVFRGMYQLGST